MTPSRTRFSPASFSWRSGQRRLDRPCKRIRKIARFDETRCQHPMQTRPFLFNVRARRAMEQVLQLQRVTLEVVELIFRAAAGHAEVGRIGPITFTNRPDMAAGNISRKEKEIVKREGRMVTRL